MGASGGSVRNLKRWLIFSDLQTKWIGDGLLEMLLVSTFPPVSNVFKFVADSRIIIFGHRKQWQILEHGSLHDPTPRFDPKFHSKTLRFISSQSCPKHHPSKTWQKPLKSWRHSSRFAKKRSRPPPECDWTHRSRPRRQPSKGISGIPSGKPLHNYAKSPFLMGKSTINGHFQ